MKKITLILSFAVSITLNAQISDTATFEELLPKVDSFLNGSTTAPMPRNFNSKQVTFSSTFDTSFGGYWKEGFAVSSMRDSSTGSASNLYSAKAASGVSNSSVYLVGQQNAELGVLAGPGSEAKLKSLYVTNTTYAYEIMENGNMFSKKFTSAGKDSFVLFIYALNNKNDSVRVDLANFTNTDTTQNFILKEWVKVTLPNGFGGGARFKLVSSDNGQFGMNTPGFFAIDDVNFDYFTGLSIVKPSAYKLFPSPTSSILYVTANENAQIDEINVLTLTGQKMLNTNGENKVDLSSLTNGVYAVQIISGNGNVEIHKIIKQ